MTTGSVVQCWPRTVGGQGGLRLAQELALTRVTDLVHLGTPNEHFRSRPLLINGLAFR
jgi:hypothetical protein